MVADAMQAWAMQQGATHYIHWFSPHDGRGQQASTTPSSTACSEGEPITRTFPAKCLPNWRGERRCPLFPSGGLRATFEARGYTAWDPTTPAFVLGTTLYIPTAFCAYTGEALDQKTPRCCAASRRSTGRRLRVLRAPGRHRDGVWRGPTVGAAQEYFLVDKDLFDTPA